MPQPYRSHLSPLPQPERESKEKGRKTEGSAETIKNEVRNALKSVLSRIAGGNKGKVETGKEEKKESMQTRVRGRGYGRGRVIHHIDNTPKPLEGEWEANKKDSSLPDNPTYDQLINAGYEAHSVTIRLSGPPRGIHYDGRMLELEEINNKRKKIEEGAANASFVFRTTEESGSFRTERVFVKTSLPEAPNQAAV